MKLQCCLFIFWLNPTTKPSKHSLKPGLIRNQTLFKKSNHVICDQTLFKSSNYEFSDVLTMKAKTPPLLSFVWSPSIYILPTGICLFQKISLLPESIKSSSFTHRHQIQNIFNQSTGVNQVSVLAVPLCEVLLKISCILFFLSVDPSKCNPNITEHISLQKNGESFSIFQFNREKDKLSCSWKEYSSTSIKRD